MRAKESCKECASTCAGCVEMAINFGFIEFDDVAHLITHPEILKPEFRNKLKTNSNQ